MFHTVVFAFPGEERFLAANFKFEKIFRRTHSFVRHGLIKQVWLGARDVRPLRGERRARVTWLAAHSALLRKSGN